MADRNVAFLGRGRYGSERAEKAAIKRIEDRNGGIARVQAKEVVKPEPDPQWHDQAKTMYVCAVADEASDEWSSGDWFRLHLLASYLSDMLNGKTRYSAQGLEIVMTGLNELRLSERVKNSDGIFVDRAPVEDGNATFLAMLDD